MTFRGRSGAALLALLVAAAGARVATREEPLDIWVARFSAQRPDALPDGWKRLPLPGVRHRTEYGLTRLDGRVVLEADADGSASGIMKKIEVDPQAFPRLEWSWNVTGALPGARWLDRTRDDFAGRLFVFFEDRGRTFLGTRALIKRLSRALPGHALNYVWATDAEVGRMGPSPYTDQVAMIAVESGDGRAGAWVVERRNVVADFTAAFHEMPGRIIGVAIMTDTDNAGGRSTAFYGDIRFLSDAGGAG